MKKPSKPAVKKAAGVSGLIAFITAVLYATSEALAHFGPTGAACSQYFTS